MDFLLSLFQPIRPYFTQKLGIYCFSSILAFKAFSFAPFRYSYEVQDAATAALLSFGALHYNLIYRVDGLGDIY